MPLPSNLTLTKEQEDKLVEYLVQRKNSLFTDNQTRILKDRESWRHVEPVEENIKEREATAKSIFNLSNIFLPITPMVVQYFVSKTEDETTAESPYFHFEPVGAPDVDTAAQYNAYYNWKLDVQGKVRSVLQDAQLQIFVQRACILKSVLATDQTTWIDKKSSILHNKETGEPVTVDGKPVIQGEDKFMEIQDPAGDVNPETGEIPTRQHLQRDPTFVLDPEKHEFKPPAKGLRRREITYRGPRAQIIDYDRFLCPSDARSVDEADCVMEMQDRDFFWFQNIWLDREWLKWETVAQAYRQGDAGTKTEGDRKTVTTESLTFDNNTPKRKVVECWVRRDVLDWGEPQELLVYLDEENSRLVWYEFQANVCYDRKRPYTTIAVAKGKQVWWGFSIPELIHDLQMAIDRLWNGQFYRQLQRSNPPKGGDPSAVEEEPENIEFDPTVYYRTRAGKSMKDLIQYAEIPNTDEGTQKLLEYLLYIIQLWLGISNIGQGDYSQQPDSNTATGVEATLRESSKLTRRWIRRVISALEEHLLKLVQLAMATFPEGSEEQYEFTSGNMRKLGTMTAEQIRNINIHVELVLSQRYSEQHFKAIDQALEIQGRYLQTPPALLSVVRPLLVDALQELGFKNTDELLPLPQGQALPIEGGMQGEPAAPVASTTAAP
jgi:hypothetical protein